MPYCVIPEGQKANPGGSLTYGATMAIASPLLGRVKPISSYPATSSESTLPA